MYRHFISFHVHNFMDIWGYSFGMRGLVNYCGCSFIFPILTRILGLTDADVCFYGLIIIITKDGDNWK